MNLFIFFLFWRNFEILNIYFLLNLTKIKKINFRKFLNPIKQILKFLFIFDPQKFKIFNQNLYSELTLLITWIIFPKIRFQRNYYNIIN